MEIITIGYGRSTVHDFESSDFRETCYMEATIESWEDAEESIKVLRQRVCLQVGIHEDIDALEHKRKTLRQEIERLEDMATVLKSKWNGLKEFNQKIEMLTNDFNPIPF